MAKDVIFSEALKKLRSSGDALNWEKRRQLAQALGRAFQNGAVDDAGIALVYLLAEDQKWEVRREIANFLPSMPTDVQVQLIALLSQDSNTYVRQAVDLAIKMRRESHRASEKKQRGLEQVQADFEALSAAHGKAAAAKARRIVDRLNSETASRVAHELLGRMTPLKSDAAILLGKTRSKKIDYREFEQVLKGHGERLDFIERFLEAMKRYSMAIPENRSRVQLSDLVAEAHGAALEKLKGVDGILRDIAFESKVPENLFVDLARLEMVVALSDLIKNAYESYAGVKRANTDYKVIVEARKLAGERVQLKVSDHGAGMNAADLADVRMYVVGKSSKKSAGIGFGIPNARRIVLAHLGEFELESLLDQGTTVELTLPIRQDRDEA